jgi:hypothetical protein
LCRGGFDGSVRDGIRYAGGRVAGKIGRLSGEAARGATAEGKCRHDDPAAERRSTRREIRGG